VREIESICANGSEYGAAACGKAVAVEQSGCGCAVRLQRPMKLEQKTRAKAYSRAIPKCASRTGHRNLGIRLIISPQISGQRTSEAAVFGPTSPPLSIVTFRMSLKRKGMGLGQDGPAKRSRRGRGRRSSLCGQP
jgi:hypothetical protein